jgi:hypothetical protein
MSSYSTTNLSEGTNLYYTDERAQDAIGNSLGTGLSYNDSTGSISNSGVLDLTGTANEIVVSTSTGSVTIGIPDSPVFVTPNIGVATATSINGTTIPSSKTLVVTTDIGSTVQGHSSTLDGINTLGLGTGFLKNTAGTWSYDSSTYLSAESDTLSSVTGRGATTSTAITISNTAQSTTPTTGALIISGGVGIAKDVWIDGDLHVNGTTVTENTKTVATHDNLIYLNAALDSTVTNAVGDGTYVTYTAENNYTPGMDIRVTGMDPAGYNISSADGLTVYSATSTQFVVAKTTTGTFVSGGTAHAKEEVNPDLGFAGGYYDAGYAHAGLFRDATDGVFKFFQGYTPEPDEAVNIDTTDVSFELADISANNATFTGNVTVDEAVLKTTSTPLTSAAATTYDTIATIPIPVGKEVVSTEFLVLLSSTNDGTYYTSKWLIFGGTVAGDPVADITEYAIMGDMAATLTTAKAGSNIELRVAVTDYTGVTAKVVSMAISAENGAT